MKRHLGFICCVLLLASSVAFAAVPRVITYQGRATANGAVLPDGNYTFVFNLAADSAAGAWVWGETQNNVPVKSGLFTVKLGAVNLFEDSVFRYPGLWLDVTVNGTHLTPRTRLLTVPFAMRANSVDGALGGSIAGPLIASDSLQATKMIAGRSATGGGFYSYGPYGVPGGILGRFYQYPEQLYVGGGVQLMDPASNTTVSMSTRSNGGGYLLLSSSLSDRWIIARGKDDSGYPFLGVHGLSDFSVDASKHGDSAVTLPDNSVNATELLNEPGLAQRSWSGGYLILPGATMTDLVTCTLTTPTAGYIVVDGKAIGAVRGTTGRNVGVVQIDETAGGAINYTPDFQAFGADTMGNKSYHFYPVYTTRTFYKPAGTYVFRLEAARDAGATGAGAYQEVGYALIRATFFPTSYGSVMAPVSSGEAQQFERATAIQASSGATLYEVDLRDLELRAARAEAAAREARLRLLEAQIKGEQQALTVERQGAK